MLGKVEGGRVVSAGRGVAAVTLDDFGEEQVQRLRMGLNLDLDLDQEEAWQMEALILEFVDVFALDSSELGLTNLVTHKIDTGDNHLIKQPARCTPFALWQTVDNMVEKMLEQGVVLVEKRMEAGDSVWIISV